MAWTDVSGFVQAQMTGFCEHGNEPPDNINVGNCFNGEEVLSWSVPGFLRSVRWFVTDVSGLHIRPILKDQAV